MAAVPQVHLENDGQGPTKRIKRDEPQGTSATVAGQAPRAFLREEDVGISEFITPGWQGFDAIIKHRYSDFFVNEIDSQGNVVHLTSFTEADDPKPPKSEAEIEIERLNVPNDPQAAFEEAFVRLNSILGAADSSRIKQHLEVTEEQTLEQRSLLLDRDLDKDQRKNVYLITNNFLPSRVTCETVDGRLKFIRRVQSDKPNADKRSQRRGGGRGPQWPHVGDFCYFVMQKENMDSMDVLNQIARQLRCKPRVFGMAGTKDKRGITVQRCSAYKVSHDRLIGVSKKLRGARLGNFSYGPRELRLGDLQGNQFQIILRHVQGADASSLKPVLEGIRNIGFINYFGMQRFGTQSISSHTIGIAVLKADWQVAVDLILSPRDGEREDICNARKAWITLKDPKEALKLLPQRAALAEYSILQNFAKSGSATNVAAAFTSIPRNLRLMYVHAYQSYIWNSAVSQRLRIFGTDGPVIGDLVIPTAECGSPAQANNSEFAEKTEESDECLNAKPTLVTAENINSYTIYDVVLPLPGWDIVYPEHSVKEVYTELMEKDGLTASGFANHPLKEYRLAGAYRHIIIKPQEFAYEWMRYNDDMLPLARSDSDAIEGKHEPESIDFGKHLALKLKFDLPSSSYATMLLRELMRQETASGFQSQLSLKTTEGTSID
ncbi:multisubstrate pseudouridine synthase 7 [Coemansia brasiliensis]|uniref:Multisubstrate pseudouridine synthase 7 n=1 Tax=Coemansia brasiliensis TaxID=2650707 RepID=A0A9W8M053_9FUNG|nr:multisubstrate pseudouridine synthase 7 [Coemansia brasiliensis]